MGGTSLETDDTEAVVCLSFKHILASSGVSRHVLYDA